MNQQVKNVINKIIPFISLGIMITVAVVGLIVMFYIFIWGALIGLVIFVAVLIKNKFFSGNVKPSPTQASKHVGRTFDHEE